MSVNLDKNVEAPEPQLLRFPLRPAPRLSGRVWVSVQTGVLISLLLFTFLGLSGVALIATIVVLVVAPVVIALLGPKPLAGPVLEVAADRVRLPLSRTEGSIDLAYHEITALHLQGGLRGFVWIGTARGSVAYPLGIFMDPEGGAKLYEAIKDRIGTLVPSRVEPLLARGAEATLALSRPIAGTLTIGLILAATFFVAQANGAYEQLFGLVRAGASVPQAIAQGEWFRLISASYLHGNLMHLMMNILGIYVVGSSVERLFGTRRFFVVYLLSAITGVALSAISANASISVGSSTAAFGLLGALAFTHYRYKDRMPEALRPPLWWWLLIGGLNLFITISVPVVDFPAHAGGFLGGVLATAWFLDRDPPLPIRESHWKPNLALAVLAGLHATGLAWAALNARSPNEAVVDQILVTEIQNAASSDYLNEIAWRLAIDPKVTPERLRNAKRAIELGLERVSPGEVKEAYQDTYATVLYRQGELDAAVQNEREVLVAKLSRDARSKVVPDPRATPPAVYATQLARFLRKRLDLQSSPQWEGATVPEVSAELVFHPARGVGLEVQTSTTTVLTAYAVAERDDGLVGLLIFTTEPGRTWLLQRNLEVPWAPGTRLRIGRLERGGQPWRAWSSDPEVLAYP